MRKPETTKNTSTPTKPAGSTAGQKWYSTTQPIATARRAWISGRTGVRAAVVEDEDISTSVGSPPFEAQNERGG